MSPLIAVRKWPLLARLATSAIKVAGQLSLAGLVLFATPVMGAEYTFELPDLELRELKASSPYFNRRFGRVTVESRVAADFLDEFRGALRDTFFASGVFDGEGERRLSVRVVINELTKTGDGFPISYRAGLTYELYDKDEKVGAWQIGSYATSTNFAGSTRDGHALTLALQRNIRGFFLNLKSSFDRKEAADAKLALDRLQGEYKSDSINVSALAGYLVMGGASVVKAAGSAADTALKVAGSVAAGVDNGNRDFSPTGPTSLTHLHNQAMANIQAMQAEKTQPRYTSPPTTSSSSTSNNRSRPEPAAQRSSSANNETSRRGITPATQNDTKVSAAKESSLKTTAGDATQVGTKTSDASRSAARSTRTGTISATVYATLWHSRHNKKNFEIIEENLIPVDWTWIDALPDNREIPRELPLEMKQKAADNIRAAYRSYVESNYPLCSKSGSNPEDCWTKIQVWPYISRAVDEAKSVVEAKAEIEHRVSMSNNPQRSTGFRYKTSVTSR